MNDPTSQNSKIEDNFTKYKTEKKAENYKNHSESIVFTQDKNMDMVNPKNSSRNKNCKKWS